MNAWKDPKCAPKKYLGNFDKFLASKMQKEKVVLIPNIYQCLNNSRIIQPLSSSTCKMTSEYFLPLIYKNNRRQVFYIICLLINFDEVSSMKLFFLQTASFLLDTGRKLNVHKTFRRRPWCLLNVLCKFNLHFVPRRLVIKDSIIRLTMAFSILQTMVFPCELCNIFQSTLFMEHLRTAASVFLNFE